MNVLPTRLSLSLAKRILKLAGGERIPIKVDCAHRVSAGNQQHWSKATLAGVKGSDILFRPINGHQVDETAPPGCAKIWQSRLTPKMRDIIFQANAGLPKMTGETLNITLPGNVEPLPQPIPSMKPLSIPKLVEAVRAAIETPAVAPAPVIAPIATNRPVVPVIAPAATVQVESLVNAKSVIALLRQFKQVKDKLEEESKIAGEAALKQLQNERLDMVNEIAFMDREIALLNNYLGRKLQLKRVSGSSSISKSQGIETTADKVMDDLLHTKLYAERKAALDLLKNGEWIRSKKIRPHIQSTVNSTYRGEINNLFALLIKRGIVEHRGKNAQMEYRLVSRI